MSLESELSKKFLSEFRAVRVLRADVIYCDTASIEVGQYVQISLTLTTLQKVLKFFRLYREPCYEVIKKGPGRISIVPVGPRDPDHHVPNNRFWVKHRDDTVTFRRPVPFRRAV